MKRLFFLSTIISLFTALACTQQTAKVDSLAPQRVGWDEYMPALYGDVDSVVITDTWEVGSREIYKFNAKGDVAEHALYYCVDSNDKQSYELEHKTCYRYNSDGLLESLDRYYEPGTLSYSTRYSYDTNGYLIEESEHDDQQRVLRRYKYDSAGNKIETQYFNRNNTLLEMVTRYKYDNRGVLTEEICHDIVDNSATMEYGIRYKYDSRGNQIEKEWFRGNEISSRDCYAYDQNNNLTEHTWYDCSTGDLGYRETYKYSDNRLIEKCIIYKNVSCSTTYKYDSQGNVIERVKCDTYPDKDISHYHTAKYEIIYRK